jgi:hypothetical protein
MEPGEGATLTNRRILKPNYDPLRVNRSGPSLARRASALPQRADHPAVQSIIS